MELFQFIMQISLPARRAVIIRRHDTQGRQGRIETGRGVCALPPRYITKSSIPRARLARFIRELHYFFSFFSFSLAARFRESIGAQLSGKGNGVRFPSIRYRNRGKITSFK